MKLEDTGVLVLVLGLSLIGHAFWSGVFYALQHITVGWV